MDVDSVSLKSASDRDLGLDLAPGPGQEAALGPALAAGLELDPAPGPKVGLDLSPDLGLSPDPGPEVVRSPLIEKETLKQMGPEIGLSPDLDPGLVRNQNLGPDRDQSLGMTKKFFSRLHLAAAS